MPNRTGLKRGDWKKLDRTILPQRRITERRSSEATECAVGGRSSKVQCPGNDLHGEVTAEADIAHVVILEVEVIIEVAIQRPPLEMKLVGSEHRIPRSFYSHIRHTVQTEVVRVVEKASAGPREIDQQIGVKYPLRPHRRRANCRDIAADKGRLRIFG